MEITQKEFEETYAIGKVLGEGSFGYVNLVKCKTDGQKYAVKRILFSQDEIKQNKLLRESKVMSKLMHENIVQCFYYATVKEKLHGKHVVQRYNARPQAANGWGECAYY